MSGHAVLRMEVETAEFRQTLDEIDIAAVARKDGVVETWNMDICFSAIAWPENCVAAAVVKELPREHLLVAYNFKERRIVAGEQFKDAIGQRIAEDYKKYVQRSGLDPVRWMETPDAREIYGIRRKGQSIPE
jgi:hypothetical protein